MTNKIRLQNCADWHDLQAEKMQSFRDARDEERDPNARISACEAIAIDNDHAIIVIHTLWAQAIRMVEREIEAAMLKGIGWAHTDACVTLDKGGDPRKTDCAEQLERAMEDLA